MLVSCSSPVLLLLAYLAVCAATRFFSFLLISLSSGLRWSKFARFLTGQSSSSCLISKGSISSGEMEGAGRLLPTTVAMGLLMTCCAMHVICAVDRTALLMGVRAGGVEVRMVLFRVWGLDVITLYGEIGLLRLGEILSKDFCWF